MNDTMSLVFLLAFVVALLLSVPYVARIRHPRSRPLAAWLIFVCNFALVTGLVYFGLVELWLTLAAPAWRGASGPLMGLVVVAVGCGFGVARWQVRRPPRRQADPAEPPPD